MDFEKIRQSKRKVPDVLLHWLQRLALRDRFAVKQGVRMSLHTEGTRSNKLDPKRVRQCRLA